MLKLPVLLVVPFALLPWKNSPPEIIPADPPDAVAALAAMPHVSLGRNADGRIESACILNCDTPGDVTRELVRLPSLRSAEFHWIALTDEDLARIGRLRKLEVLCLCQCEISDEDLLHLAKLERLKRLDLSWNSLTGDGLRQLKRLRRLKWLIIYRTRLNDAALVHVAALPGLRKLLAGATRITAAGVERLERALPKCEVQWTGTYR